MASAVQKHELNYVRNGRNDGRSQATRLGFGRRLIESSAGQLGGAIDLSFRPDGVIRQIKLPLATEENHH